MRRMDALSEQLNEIKTGSSHDTAALGQILEFLEGVGVDRNTAASSSCRESVERSSFKSISPDRSTAPSPTNDPQYRLHRHEWVREERDGKGSLFSSDPEVQQLLASDKALSALLNRLKERRQQELMRKSRTTRLDTFVISPDTSFRSWWNFVLIMLLVRAGHPLPKASTVRLPSARARHARSPPPPAARPLSRRSTRAPSCLCASPSRTCS